jgi:hypothetical protein
VHSRGEYRMSDLMEEKNDDLGRIFQVLTHVMVLFPT